MQNNYKKTMKLKTILLINPIIASKYLGSAFKKHNIRTIALYTFNMNDIEEYSRAKNESFDIVINLSTNEVTRIIEAVKDYDIDYVLNGSDQAVVLTEQIAAKLTPSLSNNPETSTLRAFKDYQQQALIEARLPAISQVKFSLKDINDTNTLDNLSYPIFAKPLNGVCSKGTFIAHSYQELIQGLINAPRQIHYNAVNEYLLQEYIYGKEIVVDTFSANSEHYVSNVYLYNKSDYQGKPFIRSVDIVNDPVIKNNAISFAISCLRACKIIHGFCHIELFMLNDGSFRLIEINPRISGALGALNTITGLTGGITQDDLLCNFIINNNQMKLPTNPLSNQFGKIILLYSPIEIDSSYRSVKEVINANSKALEVDKCETITTMDVCKFVCLKGENIQQLENDAKRLIDNDAI